MSEAFLVRRGGSGGGGTGATLTVHAPVGVTAKIVQDDKTKIKTVAANGTAVFSAIVGGQWLASIYDSTHEETTPVPVAVTTDYSVTLAFFTAYISISYPSGSTCTVSNGSITLTAPDTSGQWSCAVPEAGTWTVTATDGADSATETVSITTQGQSVNVKLSYGTLVENGTIVVAVSNSLVPSNTNQQPFRSGMKPVSIDTSNSQLIVTENHDDLASSWVVFDGTYNLADFSTLTAKFEFTQYGHSENYFVMAVLSSDLSATLAYGQQNYLGSTAAGEKTQTLSLASLSGEGKLAFAVSTQAVNSVGICKIIDFIIQ